MPGPAFARGFGPEASRIGQVAGKEDDPAVGDAEVAEQGCRAAERGGAEAGALVDDEVPSAIAEGAGEFPCELWPAVERMAAGSEVQAAEPGTGGLDGGRNNGGQARADAAQANADHPVRADLGHELLGGSEVGLGMEGVVGVALGDPELDLAWERGQRA